MNAKGKDEHPAISIANYILGQNDEFLKRHSLQFILFKLWPVHNLTTRRLLESALCITVLGMQHNITTSSGNRKFACLSKKLPQTVCTITNRAVL